MRVLIVEDYEPLRESLCKGLQSSGFAVDTASDGENGLWLAKVNEYDVIILDIMLPVLDGIEVLRQLRKLKSPAKIILLTAKDSVEDRVLGLDSGADDYLVKPFAVAELKARIRALIRRQYQVADAEIEVGGLRILPAKRQVFYFDQKVDLRPREYALLHYLALRAGEIVTRSDIWEHTYDFHSSSSSNVVDVHISILRRKLEATERPRLIHTHRGQGYCLEERA